MKHVFVIKQFCVSCQTTKQSKGLFQSRNTFVFQDGGHLGWKVLFEISFQSASFCSQMLKSIWLALSMILFIRIGTELNCLLNISSRGGKNMYSHYLEAAILNSTNIIRKLGTFFRAVQNTFLFLQKQFCVWDETLFCLVLRKHVPDQITFFHEYRSAVI